MERWKIEATLNKDRAWLLETITTMPPDEVARGATPSAHDPASMWSAKDHLSHLAGIERAFNGMIRRHLTGDANPVSLVQNPDGTRRPMEQIMAEVNRSNEDWVAQHRDKSLSAVIAVGQDARAQTLALLAELTDEQLAEKLPGALWADGTIGGVIATNAGHGRMHWQQVKAGLGIG
jgi:uncharacterized damage-inducible protein DinB